MKMFRFHAIGVLLLFVGSALPVGADPASEARARRESDVRRVVGPVKLEELSEYFYVTYQGLRNLKRIAPFDDYQLTSDGVERLNSNPRRYFKPGKWTSVAFRNPVGLYLADAATGDPDLIEYAPGKDFYRVVDSGAVLTCIFKTTPSEKGVSGDAIARILFDNLNLGLKNKEETRKEFSLGKFVAQGDWFFRGRDLPLIVTGGDWHQFVAGFVGADGLVYIALPHTYVTARLGFELRSKWLQDSLEPKRESPPR